jgi:hypothetical protein
VLFRIRVAESAIKQYAEEKAEAERAATRSRERQGERIGRIEERVALLEGADESRGAAERTRRRTQPGGIPVPAHHDESGGR